MHNILRQVFDDMSQEDSLYPPVPVIVFFDGESPTHPTFIDGTLIDGKIFTDGTTS